MSADVDILVVEDSPTQAEIVRYALEGRGYRVRIARNGRMGLDLVRERPPTIAISDIIMPEMDGYAFCRALKGDPATRHIPVILLTMLSEPDDIIRGLDCGADNFICKPFVDSMLLSRIDYFLENDELRRREDERDGPVEIVLRGERVRVDAHRSQILDLLLSAFDMALRKNEELERANRELKRARMVGTLPEEALRICARCKKIQDDRGDWIPIEEYLRAWANLAFTHEFCGDCSGLLSRPPGRT